MEKNRTNSRFKSKQKRRGSSISRFRRSKHHAYLSHESRNDDAHEERGAKESEIPGYYYDPEKKTYFKILPNHFGCGGSYVTKNTIDRNKRTSNDDLNQPGSSSFFYSSSSTEKNLKKRKTKAITSSILDSYFHSQLGQLCRETFQANVRNILYRKMRQNSLWGVSNVVLPRFGVHLEALQKMELNAKCDKAVCVWSVEADMSQRIQLMTLSYSKNSAIFSEGSNSSNFPVKFQPSKSFGVTCSSKISSLCWAPSSSLPEESCVLFTTIFPLGDFNSKVSIVNLQAKGRDCVNVFDFSLGRGAVWSSAWNQSNNRFSVGCEKTCQVIDVHSRMQWSYYTGRSDVLAQLFSSSNPHFLYNGTRSGNIFLQDLRNRCHSSSACTPKLDQKNAVVCIRSFKDDNYIAASDFSGLICLWDLRMKKIIKKYTGLANSHYQLPFYMDSTERFIYATGSDGYCKLWDQKTGDVITTIPPPNANVYPDCLPMFPITHFSTHWTGREGIVGAITGMGRKFFLSH